MSFLDTPQRAQLVAAAALAGLMLLYWLDRRRSMGDADGVDCTDPSDEDFTRPDVADGLGGEEDGENAVSEETVTVVLVGNSGEGKSTTGNTLSGRSAFAVQSGLSSVTQVCEKADYLDLTHGTLMRVVDTIGLHDTSLPAAEVLERFSTFAAYTHLALFKVRLGGVEGSLFALMPIPRIGFSPPLRPPRAWPRCPGQSTLALHLSRLPPASPVRISQAPRHRCLSLCAEVGPLPARARGCARCPRRQLR